MPVVPKLPSTPAEVVDEYLRLLMIPDPDAARRFVAPGLQIRFTGGRAMSDPAQCAAFNATRYRWVKKRIEATETVAGGDDKRTYDAHRRDGCGHSDRSLNPLHCVDSMS